MDAYEQREQKLAELGARKAGLEARRDEIRERRKDAMFRLKSLDPLKRDAMSAAGLPVEPELQDWDPDADTATVKTTARELEVIDSALSMLHDETTKAHAACRAARIQELEADLAKVLAEISELEKPIHPLRERWRRLHGEKKSWESGLDLRQWHSNQLPR